MATSLCHSPEQDSLSRDHMLHVSDSGAGPALKIALGALFGLLLALAGILSGPPQSVDRFAPPETEAPAKFAVDRDGPWQRTR